MKKCLKTIFASVFVVCGVLILLIPILRVGLGNNFNNPLLQDAKAKQVLDVAQNITNMLQHSDYEELSLYTSEYFNADSVTKTIKDFRDGFPASTPSSVQLVGVHYSYNFTNSIKQTIVDANLQYQFINKWYLVSVSYAMDDGAIKILGIHYDQLPIPLEESNKVDLSKSSILQKSILMLVVVIPLITLVALIMCLNTRNLKRKWLWVVFIILGIVTIQFDWTTQAFTVQPIGLQLLGAGYFRVSRYSPLLLTFSFPVGAIAFFVRYALMKPKMNNNS